MLQWLKNAWEVIKGLFSRDPAIAEAHRMLSEQVEQLQDAFRNAQEDVRIANESNRELSDRFDAEQRRHHEETTRLDGRMQKLEVDKNALYDKCDKLQLDLSESKVLTRQTLEKVQECESERAKLTKLEEECQKDRLQLKKDREQMGNRLGHLESWMARCKCNIQFEQKPETSSGTSS